MSDAIFAHGTRLQVDDGGYETIAEVTNISGPSISVDEIDVSSHDSGDEYREFIAGMRDGGEVSFEGNFLSSHADDVLAHLNSGDNEDWKVIFPDANDTEWAFSGFVSAFETTGNFDDRATFSATIKISGKPTLS